MEATPGPWTAHPCGSRNRTHASVTGPRGECVASCAAYPRTPEARARANARAALVAAAPDLLDALAAALPALVRLGDFVGNHDEGGPSNQGPIDRCALILQARAAIARAKGGI